MRFSWESWLLALLCSIDMVTTAWMLNTRIASEANPIMGFYVSLGIPTFIVVKTLLFFGPLFVLEVLRRHRPRFIVGLLRAGILGYLLVYGVGVWQVNSASASAIAPDLLYQQASRP